MKYRDRIEINLEVMVDRPVIKGTRIPVEFILELLTSGWTFEEILENGPCQLLTSSRV